MSVSKGPSLLFPERSLLPNGSAILVTGQEASGYPPTTAWLTRPLCARRIDPPKLRLPRCGSGIVNKLDGMSISTTASASKAELTTYAASPQSSGSPRCTAGGRCNVCSFFRLRLHARIRDLPAFFAGAQVPRIYGGTTEIIRESIFAEPVTPTAAK